MSNQIGFSLEIIKDYLISQGGKVEYHKLIKHFKDALANPENKEARVLFKDLVNQVASVTTDGNQKYLNLRKNFLQENNRQNIHLEKIDDVSPTNDLQKNYKDYQNNEEYIHSSLERLHLKNQNSNQFNDAKTILNNQQQKINQMMIKQMNSNLVPYNQIPNNPIPNSQLKNFTMDTPNLNGSQKNYVHIADFQRPFSYNLSNNLPMLNNQRTYPVDINMETNNMLLQQNNPNQTLNLNNQCYKDVKNVQQNSQVNNFPKNLPPALPARNINNIWSNPDVEDRPPKPPPRRKSFASTSNTYLNKKGNTNHVKDNENFLHSSPKQFTDKIKEINELKFNSPGRVKEHAKKLNKMVSESELKPPMPLGNNNSVNTNSQINLRDDSDLNDQIKRRWMVKSSNCDYNELQQILKDYPKMAGFKDITSGYTALHWAAKFNKPDIIKLIAGTHNISTNIKTSGYTPLHLAAMFDHKDIMELLIKGYGADETIRDYSGRTADDLLRIHNKKLRVRFPENVASRKNGHDSDSGPRSAVSLLARTASLRQTHRQLLDRLPSKYRTMK